MYIHIHIYIYIYIYMYSTPPPRLALLFLVGVGLDLGNLVEEAVAVGLPHGTYEMMNNEKQLQLSIICMA